MIETIFISALSSIVGGLVVAVVNHWLTQRREGLKKKNDLRISYLVESWKKIEKASNTESATPQLRNRLYDELEDALASISLLGSPNEVALASELAHSMARGAGADSTKLLNGLRASLRDELGLHRVNDMTFFVRMKRTTKR